MQDVVAVLVRGPMLKTKKKEIGIKINTYVRSWRASETRYLLSIWAEESVQWKLDDCYRNQAIHENIAI